MRIKYGWYRDYPHSSYWNARTPLYQGMPKFFLLYQDLNDKKLRVFLKKLKGKILDAGCGDGRFIVYANVGVDFSEGMLKRAKKRHPERNYVRASILHLPFKDKAFSSAFNVDVLLHVQPNRRKETLKEIDRVANHSYYFLAEHRTVTPFMLEPLMTIHFKWFRLIVPYIAVFFAFFFDRVIGLKIDSGSQVLEKLAD